MENTSKGRGRPPKSADERRSITFRIMLTEAERDLLDRASGGAGVASTWAREVLLKAARKAARGEGARSGLKET